MADVFGRTLDGSLSFAGAILGSCYLRRRLRRWSREDLLRWRDKRLRWLVKWAYTKSAFYRQLYDEAGVNINDFDFEDLPCVNKQMLMDNFDAVMTTPEVTRREIDEFCEAGRRGGIPSGHFKGRYLPIRSSGSTGERGLFVFDKIYFRRMLAAMASHRPAEFMPCRVMNMRLAALFSPDAFHLATTSFPRLTPLGIKAAFISASTDVGEVCRSLNRMQPNIVAGFPSLMESLCTEAAQGSLRIKPGRICCTGETLTPAAQELMERTFGCGVYNLYACAEANPMGMTYAHGQTHLKVIEDFVILEPVDEELKRVPTGQVSHGCLLTNLHSTVMPIIRYYMNDQIKFLDSEVHKDSILTTMDNVNGRKPVMIQMRGCKGERILIRPLGLINLLVEMPGVRAVQVQERESGKIQILASLADGSEQTTAREQMRKATKDYLIRKAVEVNEDTAQLEIVDRIPPDPKSGKVHGFVRLEA